MKKRYYVLSGSLALLLLTAVSVISYRSVHLRVNKNDAKTPPVTEPKFTVPAVPDIMTINEKKERFKRLLVPAAKLVYSQLEQRYEYVSKIITQGEQHSRIRKLKKEYRAETDDELLMALKPHPVSIVLAQAAIESSWGTSRFFTEANNVFGVWSFDPDEPRIAANNKRGSKIVWVKKYNNLEDSIRDYYRVIGRGVAYKEFRKLRSSTNDPFKLVTKLEKYSEKRSEYGKELSSLIRYNKFTQFDNK